METSIFKYLNGSHVYTSLIYNFLIVVPNKHSILSTQISLKFLKYDSLRETLLWTQIQMINNWAHSHQMENFKTKIIRSHQSTSFNFILF